MNQKIVLILLDSKNLFSNLDFYSSNNFFFSNKNKATAVSQKDCVLLLKSICN